MALALLCYLGNPTMWTAHEAVLKASEIEAFVYFLKQCCPLFATQASPADSPATSGLVGEKAAGWRGVISRPARLFLQISFVSQSRAAEALASVFIQPWHVSVALTVVRGSSAIRFGTVKSLWRSRFTSGSSVSLHCSEQLPSLCFVAWPLLSLHVFVWELSSHHAGDTWSAYQHMEIQNNPGLQHFLAFSPLRLLEAT